MHFIQVHGVPTYPMWYRFWLTEHCTIEINFCILIYRTEKFHNFVHILSTGLSPLLPFGFKFLSESHHRGCSYIKIDPTYIDHFAEIETNQITITNMIAIIVIIYNQ